MTGLIPLFLKTAYKKEPVFSNSKILFTIGQKTFDQDFGPEFQQFCMINNAIREKEMEPFKQNNNFAMMNGGAYYADALSIGDNQVEKELLDIFSKVKGKKVIQFNPENDLTEYLQLYSDLANK
jgi:starch synthase